MLTKKVWNLRAHLSCEHWLRDDADYLRGLLLALLRYTAYAIRIAAAYAAHAPSSAASSSRSSGKTHTLRYVSLPYTLRMRYGLLLALFRQNAYATYRCLIRCVFSSASSSRSSNRATATHACVVKLVLNLVYVVKLVLNLVYVVKLVRLLLQTRHKYMESLRLLL